jgi:hypothetical protein
MNANLVPSCEKHTRTCNLGIGPLLQKLLQADKSIQIGLCCERHTTANSDPGVYEDIPEDISISEASEC